MTEMSSADETRLARAARRALTIPAYVLAWLAALVLAPVVLPVLALLDLASGGRLALARLGLFGLVFLSFEMFGLFSSLALWLTARGARRRPAHEALKQLWATGLFRSACRIFRLRLEVEGAEQALPGPVVVLIRHASLADVLLPSVVLGARGLRLRYVLKRELLLEPCLDIVGQRLPNAFVRRGSGESAHEVAAIEALGRGLARDEGVVIYPEGTRFTPEKRARALARLEASGRPELARRGHGLRHLLPPRSAGPLALLDASGDADVLLFAHAGLDGLATLRDLARLGTERRRIRVKLWRVPRAALPAARGARLAWLYDEWARIDAWLDEVAA
jgi:1-acyl-sn-glycerol-3-phosphate acyltransferase